MILQSSACGLLVCVIASIGGQHRVEAQRWEKIVECDSRAPNDRRLLFTVDDVKEKAAAGTQVRTPDGRNPPAARPPARPHAHTHATHHHSTQLLLRMVRPFEDTSTISSWQNPSSSVFFFLFPQRYRTSLSRVIRAVATLAFSN